MKFEDHQFHEFPSKDDRRMFGDLPDEVREMMVLLPHAQAYYLLNEALQWVISNPDEYDIAELAGMIEDFSTETTNDYANIACIRREPFIKVIPEQFYVDVFNV